MVRNNMKKFLVAAALVLGLQGISTAAHATSISLTSTGGGTDTYTCSNVEAAAVYCSTMRVPANSSVILERDHYPYWPASFNCAYILSMYASSGCPSEY